MPNTRRFFLRAAGVSLALPVMESLTGDMLGSGLALGARAATVVKEGEAPTRMVCIGNHLGFYPAAFFPTTTGRDWELTPLLEPIAPYRKDLTVLSGLDHGVKGGHFAVHSYLSGVRAVDAKSMPEGNITVDQRAAEAIGGATRFPSLTIGSEDGIHGGCMMSWTRSGTRVPPIPGPNELFKKLFVTESGAERERARDNFRLHGSILDAVHGDAKSLGKRLGQRDQQKLDEYFTSVRHVEQQLVLRQQWADVPKPETGMKEPPTTNLVSDLPVLYELIALALETDSTRIATLEIAGGFEGGPLGVKKGYHSLSHHGHVQENIDGLLKLELYQMQQFAGFLKRLKSSQDGDGTLLDHTMVLFGSGMGNGNAHLNTNLPIVLAGLDFKHGEYKAFPEKGLGKRQLCNLFLTMLQRFGVETDSFGLSTGTLTGMEAA